MIMGEGEKPISKTTRGYVKSKIARHYQREYLVLRDGYKCQTCGLSGHEIELVVHHKDGNTRNNALPNLNFQCRSDNTKLQWINMREKKTMGEAMTIITSQKVGGRKNVNAEGVPDSGCTISLQDASPELKINRVREPAFRKWLLDKLLTNPDYQEGILSRDVIFGGAEKFSCSPNTTRRYLEKMISPEGMFRQTRSSKGDSIIQFKLKLKETD